MDIVTTEIKAAEAAASGMISMSEWAQAGSIAELKDLLATIDDIGDPERAQRIKFLTDQIDNINKKIADMRKSGAFFGMGTPTVTEGEKETIKFLEERKKKYEEELAALKNVNKAHQDLVLLWRHGKRDVAPQRAGAR